MSTTIALLLGAFIGLAVGAGGLYLWLVWYFSRKGWR